MATNKTIGLSKEELEILKNAFDLFDTDHTGKANIKDLKETLISCGYEEKNPVIFDIIAELDTPENNKNGGVSFFDFIDHINERLSDRESEEGLRRIYYMFIDDSNSIKKESLKQICYEIGKDYNDKELNELLDKCAKHGTDLTYDEFKNIMLGEYEI